MKRVIFLAIKLFIRFYDFFGHVYHYIRFKKKYGEINYKFGKKLNEITSKDVAIYHIYSNSITSDRAKYVNLLLKNNFHVIICSSLPISGFDQEAFNNISNVSVFEKPNVGRDMYIQDLLVFLADKNVLFTNDSLFFFESHSKILDQNIYDMIHNGDKDVYGLTINYASHKHIGSFFLYVKKNTKAYLIS